MRIILIGGNETVYFLARQFRKAHHVTIINRDPARCKELARQTHATVVFGDGTDPTRLEEAGARMADVLLALTRHDEDNLIACQIAQKMFEVPRTMALVNDPENEVVFQKLGVSVAFSATRVLVGLIENQANFQDVIAQMPIDEGQATLTDVRLDSDAPAVGKTLQEIHLSDESLIVGIVRNHQMLIPRGSTRLEEDDHLLLLTHPDKQAQDLVTLCGEK